MCRVGRCTSHRIRLCRITIGGFAFALLLCVRYAGESYGCRRGNRHQAQCPDSVSTSRHFLTALPIEDAGAVASKAKTTSDHSDVRLCPLWRVVPEILFCRRIPRSIF